MFLSVSISRSIKKEEVLNVVNCYSLQLDICSYDRNDLHVKQRIPSYRLLLTILKALQNPNQERSEP